ncbi:uncharacterized protein PAC_03255 [Phialocephala subalpina]|uniref:Uncharacterized protein n=1 Tax=Phialocephala subalpina TaxID=576137 RepID=A0A1L7WKT5_9HELO|nr:uncharacterized protein PAC_03255 [Phialocephala subalpina]
MLELNILFRYGTYNTCGSHLVDDIHKKANKPTKKNSNPDLSILPEAAAPVNGTVDEVENGVMVVEGVGVALKVLFPGTMVLVDTIALVVEIYVDVDAGELTNDSVAVTIG